MPPQEQAKEIPVEPGGEGFVPVEEFQNPGGDRLGGTKDGFEAFEGAVEPPGGFPGGESPPAEVDEEKAVDNPEGDRPPVADQEKKADQEEEQSPPDEQAAPETDDTAAAKDETGKDEQSPESPVAGILAKYGTQEELGKAYQSLQRLESLKGKDLKDAKEQLSAELKLVDEFFITDENGNRSLRTDKVVEHLQSTDLPPAPADVKAITDQVMAERRKMFVKAKIEDEYIDEALDNIKEELDAEVKVRVQGHNNEMKRREYEQEVRASTIAHAYFAAHPEHKEVIEQVDKQWFARFPKALRSRAINENWLPIPQIAQAEYLKANLAKIVDEAYQAGLEHREMKPMEGGSPSSSGPAPDARGEVSPDDQIKLGILNAGNMKSLDSIFGDD